MKSLNSFLKQISELNFIFVLHWPGQPGWTNPAQHLSNIKTLTSSLGKILNVAEKEI